MSATYDANLANRLPAVTKEQMQGGYSADLLAEKPPTPHDLESSPQTMEKPFSTPTKVPFWRTTKGILIIGVATVVILAAVIGGAVGGSKKKSKEIQAVGIGNTTITSNSQAAGPATPPAGATTTPVPATTTPINGGPGGAPPATTTTTPGNGQGPSDGPNVGQPVVPQPPSQPQK